MKRRTTRGFLRRIVAVGISALFVGGCGGGGMPSAAPAGTPVAPSPVPEPQGWTLAGTVTDALTGAPIGGAALAFEGSAPVAADPAGGWRISGVGVAPARQVVSISAPGYLTRDTGVRATGAGRQAVAIDLIPNRTPFSLAFYRQFVRDGFDRPTELQLLRRWTKEPNFYVHTFNPKTGLPIEPGELTLVTQAIRDSVPQLTGGTLGAGAIESGAEARAPRSGYINVRFVYDPKADYCGLAYVGADPGEITINYDRCARACGSLKVAPEAIAHEVGHAMGFWHAAGDYVMNPTLFRRCSSVAFSDAERLHARIAYQRPKGNTDLDRDPEDFASALQEAPPPLVVCGRGRKVE